MGAGNSTHSTAACESASADDAASASSALDPSRTTPNDALAPSVPMPQLMRQETFQEKLYRKFTAEPLVPIGCLTTAYFLGSGIRSFYNRDPVKSQKMMRLRVGSQFATIMIFVGYAGWNSFTFDLAPGMAVPSEQFPMGKGEGSGGNGGE
ncbi:hypothetical protein ACHAWF_007577 [Thalassiosira exigua]